MRNQPKGETSKGPWSGMQAGITEKLGNADGVKACTARRSRVEKHPLHSEVENGWQQT